jgi:hypothetical protein
VHALAGELLLQAWEEGASVPEPSRPLALLGLAMPDRDPLELADIPVAECNRLLLRLRELSFGAELSVIAACSSCSSQLELAVPVAKLAALSERDGSAEPMLSEGERTGLTLSEGNERAELTLSEDERAGLAWTDGGRRFELRHATTADLLASLELAEVGAAQELLLSRCLTVDPPQDADRLSETPMVLEQFERLHAATELRCSVVCPECTSEEVVDLDIGRFLWTEVRRAASRLLREIHALAAGYGWSEQAILAMSERRRTAYLEMVAL